MRTFQEVNDLEFNHAIGKTFTRPCVLSTNLWGPSWLWSYGSWIYNYQCNQCLSPLMLWGWISIRVKCTTLQMYVIKFVKWLVTGQWFSPGPLVSSTSKTDRHDKTEILLKVVLNTIKPKQTTGLQ